MANASPSPGRASGAGRKQLTFCELAWLPISVGDFLLHQQAALAACRLAGMEAVDLVYLLNAAEHLDATFTPYVTSANQYHCVLNLLRLVDFNPLADQVRIIRSKDEAGEFLARRAASYGAMWPAPEHVQRYFYYDGLARIRDCHQRFGDAVFLRAPGFLRRWARGFFARRLPGRLPISVNIRNNPRFAVERNADLEAWLAFLDRAQARGPVGFVIVGSTEEADPRFREIPNVVLAKDHHTDLACDLALIDAAAAHIGMASGASLKAILGTRPYFLARTTSDLKALGELAAPRPGGFAFAFSTPDQIISHDRDSPERLLEELERIVEAAARLPFEGSPEPLSERPDGANAIGADWLR